MTDTVLPSSSDSRALRDAFSNFATGITLVTTQADIGPVGFIANSFSSLSLDPALVMWALSNTARRRGYFAEAEHFAIHILRADQADICEAFTSQHNAFDDLPLVQNLHGTPVLGDCLARFDCQKYATYPGGDHTIILGKVDAFQNSNGPGIVYMQGGYYPLGHENS